MNTSLKKERFKIVPFVSLILRKDDKLLLIRRAQTGCDDGFYCCAGGGVDGNEPITHALIREAKEELGIQLKKEHVKVVHVLHKRFKTAEHFGETIGFFVEATEWEGEPQNMEPHLHDDIAWFPIHDLPNNTMESLKHVIKMLAQNISFSEHGWE
jgi:ADP-ribose pyrophosphatase YjhB (NUDIX family)